MSNYLVTKFTRPSGQPTKKCDRGVDWSPGPVSARFPNVLHIQGLHGGIWWIPVVLGPVPVVTVVTVPVVTVVTLPVSGQISSVLTELHVDYDEMVAAL